MAVKFGGTLFSFKPSGITIIWLPSGIGLVMLIKWGLRAAPFIYIADFIGNFPGVLQILPLEMAVYHTIFSSLADLLAPILGMFLFRRYLHNGLQSSKDVFTFFFCTCLAPLTLSSLLISTNLVFSGIVEKEQFSNMVRMLFFADSLGVFWVYHIYSGWLNERNTHLSTSFIASTFLVVFLLSLGFNGYPWLIYLIPPILISSAFGTDQFKVGLLSSISMIVIIVATARGHGPLGNISSIENNTEVMAFIFAIAFTLLGVSSQNSKLRRWNNKKLHFKDVVMVDDQALKEEPLATFNAIKKHDISIKKTTLSKRTDNNVHVSGENKHANEQLIIDNFDGLLKENAFLSKAKDCLLVHLHESDFDVKALAAQLFMSRSTLQRKIKSQTHFTTGQFIRHIRLEKAHEYIQSNVHRTIAETAYAVGFKHPGHFSKLYQKYCQQLEQK